MKKKALFLNLLKRIKLLKSNNASIIKSLYYNYRYLPSKQAIFLPLIVSKNAKIIGKGTINIPTQIELKNVKIYVGCQALRWNVEKDTVIVCEGRLDIQGENIFIGSGSKIEIAKDAIMILKNKFNITGNRKIICEKTISFGEDNLISWDTLIMDTDAHTIKSEKAQKSGVHFGNHIWLAANTNILPGTILMDNIVVGCGAVVKGKYEESNCILAGIPARVIKKNISWNIEKPKG